MLVAWPYMLGSWIAMQFGAANPSTVRFLVGWTFEVLYFAGLAALVVKARKYRAQRAAEEAQRMAEPTASGAVYEARHGRSVVYRHGTCHMNHRSPETAASCRKSSPAPPWGMGESTVAASSLAATPRETNRAAVGWAAAVVGVGLVIGLVIAASQSTHLPAATQPTTAPAAEPPAVAVPPAAKPLPAGCPALPQIGAPGAAFGSDNVTLPDLAGTNGADAEQCLRNLGLYDVELSSVSAEHHYVVLAADWTVVSTDPPAGAVVSYPNERVVLNVTKP